MNEELKDALSKLALDMEGKNTDQIKSLTEAFEAKFADAVVAEIKKGNLVDSETMQAELKKVQDHADALDLKLQEQGSIAEDTDEIKDIITDNFTELKAINVGSGNRRFELKAPMVLATNLVGDQPRQYSSTMADIPSPMVNFRDLVGAINIGTGTLTFPKETANTGAVATQTEGSAKAEVTTTITMVDVNTDFLAGFTRYSKKMANNLPFLQSWLPSNLRRKYLEAENTLFYTALSVGVTASTVIVGTVVERIVKEQSQLLAANFVANAIVVNAADYASILLSAGATGGSSGTFSLPGVVSIVNGVVSINGIAVYVAPWMPANKYIIGAWGETERVETQGLAVNFFEQDQDNVVKNLITARIEAQVGLAIYRGDAFRFGDFTAVA